MFLCYRPHVPGTAPRLAGMYGMYLDAELGVTYWPNPAARNRATCPAGATTHAILGTPGVDHPAFYCLASAP